LVKLIILPVAVSLSTRYGKIKVMQWAMISGFIGSALSFVLITPNAPYLQLVSALLMSPAYTAFWLLVDPMKADCADYDEWKTGLRREGSYASVANWIEKMCVSLVLLLSGVVLDLSGFDAELGAAQPEGTLLFMRAFLAFAPALSLLIGLVALRFYGLGDERMAQIRAELEERRGGPKDDSGATVSA
jgi:GPH family glycoside/pentoside/hexuronide:cation symporter